MAKVATRNLGIRKIRVGDILDHELNFRLHTDGQREALGQTIDHIGWYGYPDVYQTPDGLKLIDGHLRKQHLIDRYGEDAEIEVNITDFDASEATVALATHDPLAAMAETSKDALRELIETVDDETTLEVLKPVAFWAELVIGDEPKAEEVDVDAPPIKTVSLHMSTDEHELFLSCIDELKQVYGAGSVSEVVRRAVRDAVERELQASPSGQ